MNNSDNTKIVTADCSGHNDNTILTKTSYHVDTDGAETKITTTYVRKDGTNDIHRCKHS